MPSVIPSPNDDRASSSDSSTQPHSTLTATIKPRVSRGEQIVISLASGAVAGGIAKTVIAPLDRSKIFFQTNEVRNYRFKHAIRWLRHGYQTEGLFSLWRGNSATMARIIPYAAIQFMAHEQYKVVLRVEETGDTKRRFMAGAMAGVTSQLVTYPLDRARAVMAVSRAVEYRNLPTVFRTIAKVEGGYVSMYRGLFPTLCGAMVYSGVSFTYYGSLKAAATRQGTSNDLSPGPLQRMLYGAGAGVLGQTASYPLDIVRRRMQTSIQLGKGEKYSTMLKTFIHVYRTEGLFRGLYKGLSMNFVKGPIASGITFALYDYACDFMRGGVLYLHTVEWMPRMVEVLHTSGLMMEYHRTYSETAHAAHGT